jgi:hypothetical protein
MRRPRIIERTEPLGARGVHPAVAQRVRDVLVSALGVNVDPHELDAAEQHELAELVEASQADAPPGATVDLSALSSREQRRVEALTEQAVGERGLFDRLREERKHAAQVAAIAKRVNRPKPVTSALSGDVLDQLAGGFLDLDHLTMLAFVSVILDAAEVPAPWAGGMRFEAGALVLEWISVDLGDPSNVGGTLLHLAANGWLEVEGSQQRAPWTIKPGPRLKRARREGAA